VLHLAFLVGFLLVLATPAKYLLTQLSYSLAGSLPDLSRAFPGTDSNILAGRSSAFAEIGRGATRMQSHEIAGSPAGALA